MNEQRFVMTDLVSTGPNWSRLMNKETVMTKATKSAGAPKQATAQKPKQADRLAEPQERD